MNDEQLARFQAVLAEYRRRMKPNYWGLLIAVPFVIGALYPVLVQGKSFGDEQIAWLLAALIFTILILLIELRKAGAREKIARFQAAADKEEKRHRHKKRLDGIADDA